MRRCGGGWRWDKPDVLRQNVGNGRVREMKLVQINRTDVTGGRFNGFSVRDALAGHGVQSTHLVWQKTSTDPRVQEMLHFPGSRFVNRALSKIERELSMHSVLQLQSFALPMERAFREADVAHYHIIHDGFFSLHALPMLARMKPSVWTWHDPWPMTGHCVYSMGCDRWRTGCGACPDLSLFFAMKQDRTAQAHKTKRDIIRKTDIDIVLASQYMLDMARISPAGANARLHHIPFGLDLDLYRPRDRVAARRRFGIDDGRVVISLRAISSTFKGLPEFVEAINRLDTRVPIAILSFQETGYFNNHIGRHQIVELGWVKDDRTMVDALNATDIFAMPSTAEAFGLMAIEAMAVGLPVVVFEGTSLPEVVFAPDAGVAVPMRDARALAAAFKRLIEDPQERRVRGDRSRALAERHYGQALFVERLVKLYRDVLARRVRGRVSEAVHANLAAH